MLYATSFRLENRFAQIVQIGELCDSIRKDCSSFTLLIVTVRLPSKCCRAGEEKETIIIEATSPTRRFCANQMPYLLGPTSKCKSIGVCME